VGPLSGIAKLLERAEISDGPILVRIFAVLAFPDRTRGSGTIFFAGCNLRCVFCQNGGISQRPVGERVTAIQLAGLMLELQARGRHNINVVTPRARRPAGARRRCRRGSPWARNPLVYNTSAYDALERIALLDVYMPDLKLWDPTDCRYLGVRDYPQVTNAAVAAMHARSAICWSTRTAGPAGHDGAPPGHARPARRHPRDP
jgi:uncharacterized Fe-S radical SAM superfamily protein PflX